jgi:hypothetical protein
MKQLPLPELQFFSIIMAGNCITLWVKAVTNEKKTYQW